MGDRVPSSMTIPVILWYVRADRWEPDAEFVAIAFAGLPDGTCTSAGVASLQVCLEISSVTAEDAAGFPDSFRPVKVCNPKIGRASCRERGWISVGGGCVKRQRHRVEREL